MLHATASCDGATLLPRRSKSTTISRIRTGAAHDSFEVFQQLRFNLHHRSAGTTLALKGFGESTSIHRSPTEQRTPESSIRSAQSQSSSMRYTQARLRARSKIDLSKMDSDFPRVCHTDLRSASSRGTAAKKTLAHRFSILNVPRRLCAFVYRVPAGPQ